VAPQSSGEGEIFYCTVDYITLISNGGTQRASENLKTM
jgi:hypothetical protein